MVQHQRTCVSLRVVVVVVVVVDVVVVLMLNRDFEELVSQEE
jgi:hypothetical protein